VKCTRRNDFFAAVQMCRCADVQMCRCADVQMCFIIDGESARSEAFKKPYKAVFDRHEQ